MSGIGDDTSEPQMATNLLSVDRSNHEEHNGASFVTAATVTHSQSFIFLLQTNLANFPQFSHPLPLRPPLLLATNQGYQFLYQVFEFDDSHSSVISGRKCDATKPTANNLGNDNRRRLPVSATEKINNQQQ